MSSQKEIRTISPAELLLILAANEFNNGSCEFIQFTADTVPALNKKNRDTKEPFPYGKVIKRTETQCALKVNYENRVNKVLENAGIQEKGEHIFEAESLPWGKWLELDGKTSKVLLTHEKDGQKLFYIRTTFINPDYKPKVQYFQIVDGQEIPIEKELLKPYMAPDRGEEVVPVRNYGLHTMKQVHLNGVIYKVTP